MSILDDAKQNLGPKPVLSAHTYPDRFYSKEDYCHPNKWLGVLEGENGERLNKNVRNKYYPKMNSKHIAKTPLHAIRWAIDTFTNEGDTILDPFAGSGTTAVEAFVQDRKFVGVEYEFFHEVLVPTVEYFLPDASYSVFEGDSELQLDNIKDGSCALVNFSNPYPDGGDHTKGIGDNNTLSYKKGGNSGLMKSNDLYWQKMKAIQDKSCQKLKVGGHAIFVIKDMMKKKQVWQLHKMLADLMPDNMEHIGTIALDHYPRSLFMNTYENFHGTRPPLEQVCPIFKRIK
jgi:DNA modification methylase